MVSLLQPSILELVAMLLMSHGTNTGQVPYINADKKKILEVFLKEYGVMAIAEGVLHDIEVRGEMRGWREIS